MVAVAQGLVEYWDSRCTVDFLALRTAKSHEIRARSRERNEQGHTHTTTWVQVRATQPAAVKCTALYSYPSTYNLATRPSAIYKQI